MQEKVKQIFKPDAALIRQHLQFIVTGMKQYAEGRLEISYCDDKGKPNHSANFGIDEIEKAVSFSVEKNAEKRNVYVTGALIDPDAESMAESKRSRDDDFFACNSIWCDIDNKGAPITPEELRKKYIHFPPSLVVVTGRHHNGQPHLRVHLWWKLDEPVTSGDEIRRIVRGIQQTLGGDAAAANECRIMRLGGTVAWPAESKPGRITEMTEVQVPKGAQPVVNAEALIRSYPEKQSSDDIKTDQSATEKRYTSTVAGLAPESVDDGRDAYMSDMVYASIVNLAGEHARWPTAQEVYDDVWPVYSRKVHPRDPRRSLDDEGRGSKVLQQKIKSKLRLFHSGRMRGVTLDDLIAQGAKRKSQQGQSHSSQQSQDRGQQSKSENASHETPGAAPGAEQQKPFKIDEWVASKRYAGTAKPIKWLIEGVFPAGVPCLLAAMGGLGKSFIALDMAIKIAMPSSTLGDHKVLGRSVMSHGKAVLITAEDSFDSIHRRINKLAPTELLAKTLDNLIVIPMSEVDISQLLVREGRNGLEMTDFFIDIKNQLMAIKDLKFIGIDPLQAFVGADITAKPEAAQFMWSAFAKIASQTGATFFATHHMRKDGMGEIRTAADAREGIRGTTGLVDGARAVYVMWQAVNDVGDAIARSIGVSYEPHRFVQGSIVKANDEADHSVMSFYRKDEGLLFCLGQLDISAAPKDATNMTPNQDAVYRAIKNAMTKYARLVTVHRDQKPIMAISFDEMRKQLEAEGYKDFLRKDGDTDREIATRAKNGTTSARNALQKRGLIGCEQNWIWLIEKEAVMPSQEFDEMNVPAQKTTDERYRNEFE